jgi:hypothetical protein
MGLLRAHLAAVAIVAAAVLATVGVFLFAPPTVHRYRMPKPPGDGLPYTTPVFSKADAVRAFAHVGVRLLPGATSPGISGGYTHDFAFEVTVFGDRKLVDAQGFSDYYTFVDGKWLLAPKTCARGAKSAERWRVNVRVIVTCGAGSVERLRTATRALAALR